MKARTLALLCGLVLLAGCGTAGRGTSPGESVNLSGYPPAFRDGYKDGCSSTAARRVRNDKRFKEDPQYASGWRDGQDICGRKR